MAFRDQKVILSEQDADESPYAVILKLAVPLSHFDLPGRQTGTD